MSYVAEQPTAGSNLNQKQFKFESAVDSSNSLISVPGFQYKDFQDLVKLQEKLCIDYLPRQRPKTAPASGKPNIRN